MSRPSVPFPGNRSAFTLVELMVVLAILAILVSILLPLCGKAIASSRQSACKQNLRGAALMVMREQPEDPAPIPGIAAPPADNPGMGIDPPVNPGCPYCNPPWAPGKPKPGPAPVPSPAEPDWMKEINRSSLCPEAPRNPAARLDPRTQPARFSFGLLNSYRQDPHASLHWVLADSDVPLVTTRSEVAFGRHRGKANIGRVDGSVLELSHSETLWPGKP